MARKFIEFLEAAALIILTGVLVVGVIKYIDSREEPKEEDPTVEVNPDGDEETPTVDEEQPNEPAESFSRKTIEINVAGPGTGVKLSFEYNPGMTWQEAIDNNPELLEQLIINEDGTISVDFGEYGVFGLSFGNEKVKIDETIYTIDNYRAGI